MTRIAVAVISHNTQDLVRNCLRSVLRESPAQIIVADSASTDGTVEMVHSEFPQVRCIPLTDNRGYGYVSNLAIAAADCEYVLLLNSDTILKPGTLRVLAEYLDRNPAAAMVGPRLIGVDGKLQHSCRRFPGTLSWAFDNHLFGSKLPNVFPWLRTVLLRAWPHDHERDVPWVMGAALAIRRAAFDQVGGFSKSYFMYCEDIDLCYRLRSAGWKIRFTPHAEVVHLGGASTAKAPGRMQAELAVSMCRFYQDHYSGVRRRILIGLAKALCRYRYRTGQQANSSAGYD